MPWPSAAASLERGRINAGINQGEAFKGLVEAQTGKEIAEASLATVAACDLVEALRCL